MGADKASTRTERCNKTIDLEDWLRKKKEEENCDIPKAPQQ